MKKDRSAPTMECLVDFPQRFGDTCLQSNTVAFTMKTKRRFLLAIGFKKDVVRNAFICGKSPRANIKGKTIQKRCKEICFALRIPDSAYPDAVYGLSQFFQIAQPVLSVVKLRR